MNFAPIICRRGAPVPGWCGLVLALVLAAGCSPHGAAPSAPAKAKTEAKANSLAGAQTNLSGEYASVFEDLPAQKGQDPFFPYSHRRDPKIEALPELNVRVDPVLVLKAIIRTHGHSQAVINNDVFEMGEEQSVRVPNGHVGVRCIKISQDYVVIQVDGEAEPKRLLMDQKKN
jgi:hypothetical protein